MQDKTLHVQHWPTEEMVTDFFTKPLQGSLFVKLQNLIMGAEYADPDQQTNRRGLDEDDGSWHSEDDSEAKSPANKSEPAGTWMGA